MSQLFRGSRLKLERAGAFIDELENLEKAWAASNPITGRLKGNFMEMSFNVPEKAQVITGDIIHNMRAALDLLACEAARITSGKDTGVLFPFAKSAVHLEQMIKDKKFALAGADAVDLVRKIAPHSDSNPELRAIHELDIGDKHVDLIQMPSSVTFDFVAEYKVDDPNHFVFKADIDIFYFTLPKASVFKDQRAADTLRRMLKNIGDIVDQFDNMIASRI